MAKKYLEAGGYHLLALIWLMYFSVRLISFNSDKKFDPCLDFEMHISSPMYRNLNTGYLKRGCLKLEILRQIFVHNSFSCKLKISNKTKNADF